MNADAAAELMVLEYAGVMPVGGRTAPGASRVATGASRVASGGFLAASVWAPPGAFSISTGAFGIAARCLDRVFTMRTGFAHAPGPCVTATRGAADSFAQAEIETLESDIQTASASIRFMPAFNDSDFCGWA